MKAYRILKVALIEIMLSESKNDIEIYLVVTKD